MIQVQFADDSKRELMLVMQSPPCDAVPPNVERAPDLLFSALNGKLALPSTPAETPPPAIAPAPERRVGTAPWGESLAPIAALRRKHNPLYGMWAPRSGG